MMLKQTLIIVAAALTLAASVAGAEETRVGVGVLALRSVRARVTSGVPRSSRSVNRAMMQW